MEQEGKKNPLHALAFLKMGLFEFGFVAVVLFLLFGTLNYFNILPVSDVFPQLSFLPRLADTKQSRNANFSSLPKIATNPLINKAKTLGYNIIQIDPKDSIGRTVFYENRINFNNEGMGIKISKNINGKQFISQIVGAFEDLKDIRDSSDKYLSLTNPTTKEQFPLVRILMNSAIASPSGELLTYLIVEDLNYNGEIASLSAQNLGSLRRFSEKEIKEIFHKGDAVAVGLITSSQGNALDKNQELESLVIFIRRFEGKEQIEKELGKTL